MIDCCYTCNKEPTIIELSVSQDFGLTPAPESIELSVVDSLLQKSFTELRFVLKIANLKFKKVEALYVLEAMELWITPNVQHTRLKEFCR